jgi:hypothetical protein
MPKKYEFTGNVIQFFYLTLRQIRATRDFDGVCCGEIGGWIESESNLSHDGDCWVSGGGKVYGNARVYDNARLHDNARVFGNAQVSGNAGVFHTAAVFGTARVYGNAEVSE